MDNKKHFLDYLAQIFQIFGITILNLAVFACMIGDQAASYSTMFALGHSALSVSTLFQFLLSSACITALRFVFFTDTFFKKMSLAIRTILMILCVIFLAGVFAYLFGWFPVSEPRCWLAFFICFGICFAVSAVLSVLKERRRQQTSCKRSEISQGGYIRWNYSLQMICAVPMAQNRYCIISHFR